MEKLIEKFNLNTKKGIENLVIFLVLVIIVMVVINSLFEENEEIIETSNVQVVSEKGNSIEEKLENILSSIRGVGKVNVMISYTNSIEKVPIYDTKETTTVIEEKDTRRRRKKNKRSK